MSVVWCRIYGFFFMVGYLVWMFLKLFLLSFIDFDKKNFKYEGGEKVFYMCIIGWNLEILFVKELK